MMKTTVLGMAVKVFSGISVKFGWINVFGAVIALLLLIPYVIFEIKFKDRQRRRLPAILRVFEILLWIICCMLMVVNVGFFEFGFDSKALFIIYLVGTAVLLVDYYITWLLFFIKPAIGKRLNAAVTAVLVFCISGVTLTNILLIVFASLFGTCHIFMAAQDKYE